VNLKDSPDMAFVQKIHDIIDPVFHLLTFDQARNYFICFRARPERSRA
jgi:hypothetical protein